MSKRQRKKYDREFKLKTVEMSKACGNIVQLARDLGIRPELIYRWRSELEANPQRSFPGEGNKSLSLEESEVAQLRKVLAEKEMELEILKKALGIFSRRDG